MRKAFLVIAVLGLITPVALATAGDFPSPLVEGAQELRLQGSYAHESYDFDGIDLGSATRIDLGVDYGIFLTDNFEVMLGGFIQKEKLEPETMPENANTVSGISLELLYNFSVQGRIVPFLGVGAGLALFDGDDLGDETGWMLPVIEGGFRVLLSQDASVVVALNYRQLNNADGLKDVDSDGIGTFVGLTVFP